jgi:hypothetical protein
MSDDLDITFTDTAYAKMMLHILKHVTSDCHGVLVGHKEESNTNKITITNAYPLFHTNISVPQLDLGLRMIEHILKTSNEKDVIVGIYENMLINFEKESAQHSTAALFICDSIQKTKSIDQPILVEISHSLDKTTSDGKKVKDSIEYKLYRYNANVLREAGYIKENDRQFSLMKSLLNLNLQAEIIDLDEHLFNTKLDLTNKEIDSEINDIINKA